MSRSTRRPPHPPVRTRAVAGPRPARSQPGVCPLALVLALACGGAARLEHELARVGRALTEVEARGALRCAPRELAIARSQLEFAALERDQGFPSRAERHLTLADENLRAASVLTPPGRCTDSVAPAGTVPAASSSTAPVAPSDTAPAAQRE